MQVNPHTPLALQVAVPFTGVVQKVHDEPHDVGLFRTQLPEQRLKPKLHERPQLPPVHVADPSPELGG
jgi:hypothetical protein